MTTRLIHFRVTVEIDEDAARAEEDEQPDWMTRTNETLAAAMAHICQDNLPAATDPVIRVRRTGVSIDYLGPRWP